MSSDSLSRRLSRWGVASCVADRISRRHSSVFELLTLTPVELLSVTNRNPDHDRRQIVDVIAAQRAPTFQSVSRLAGDDHRRTPFKTSLNLLDEALCGGLPRGSLTELVGPPGAGKTQFCFMLAGVAASGVNDERTTDRRGEVHDGTVASGKVAYVDTEGAFCSSRLFEMMERKFPRKYGSEREIGDPHGADGWKEELGEKVMVYYAPTCEKLVATLDALDVDVVKYGFDLVILDSIASVVRKEFHGGESGSLIDRAKLLAREAKVLKELAQHHDIPILVTNQITTRYQNRRKTEMNDEDEDNDEGDDYLQEPRGCVTAALGNSWSHFVNTRIAIDFDEPSADGDDEDASTSSGAASALASNPMTSHLVGGLLSTKASLSRRTLKLLKSPYAPQTLLTFGLDARGPFVI